MVQASSQPTPELSLVLKEALRQRGLSIRAAAAEIVVSENTVRQWMTRNKFPPDKLTQLATLADLPTKEVELLQKQYQFGLIGGKSATDDLGGDLSHALRLMDNRLEALDPQGRWSVKFAADVAALFGAMGKDDVYAYWSIDQAAVEMGEGWHEMSTNIVKAISLGSFFLYFVPTEELLASLRKTGLIDLPSADYFNEAFNEFRNRLKDKLPSNHLGILTKQLHKIEVKHSAFAAPRTKYGLMLPHANGSSRQPRAIARFPTGNQVVSHAFFLPLDYISTSQFVNFLVRTLRNGTHAELAQLLT